jgi:hypothetical protein
VVDLVDALRAAGLKVGTVDGYADRGGSWSGPVGIMEHHTAPPVPFPPDRLIGEQLKANMSTDPDGTVWVLAYGSCNYSSGSGSSVVLAEVRAGTPPTENASDRGLDDDVNGNPYFWNFENGHPGDGSPIPEIQLDAIAMATAVVCDHFGLSAANVISHAEWTARKSDPYWNNNRRAIVDLRAMVEEVMTMPTADEIRQIVREELDRRIDGRLGEPYGFTGTGQSVVSTQVGSTGPDGSEPPWDIGKYLRRTFDKVNEE